MGCWTCLPVFAGVFVCFFEKYVFVADFDAFVGDTPRLDTSAHKAKAQLALKVKRQPPSRSKLKESLGGGQQTASLQVLTLMIMCSGYLTMCWVLSVFAVVSVLHASFRLCQSILVLCCIRWKSLLGFMAYMGTLVCFCGTVNWRLAKNYVSLFCATSACWIILIQWYVVKYTNLLCLHLEQVTYQISSKTKEFWNASLFHKSSFEFTRNVPVKCSHVSGRQLKNWGIDRQYMREPIIKGGHWTNSVRLKTGCIELEWLTCTRTFLIWLEKVYLGCAERFVQRWVTASKIRFVWFRWYPHVCKFRKFPELWKFA